MPGHVVGVLTVEERLTRVLGAWAAGSVTAGAVLLARPRTRAAGRQHLLWGAVDGAIAIGGARARARRGPTDARRLRAVLLGNVVLDVGYVATGLVAARRPRWRQDGRAVALQGLFLLGLDGWAVRALARERGRVSLR